MIWEGFIAPPLFKDKDMPKYKVEPETWGICSSPCTKDGEDKKHYPTVYFPISKEILKALEVGQVAEITLKGKVTMLESRESEGSEPANKCECRIEVHEVEAYAAGEFEKMADDTEEE